MTAGLPSVFSAIHPTALVDPEARVSPSATIGPYSIIGPGVDVGSRVDIGSHVFVQQDTLIGEDCRIHHGAVLGSDPQDLKYQGESTRLEIGAGTTIREHATLNRGTGENGITRVGRGCLLMAYSHVAHDCTLGDGVILANSVNLAGHVEIGDQATVGGIVGVHQFVRIGHHAFVGACSKLSQDIPPYLLVDGNPCRPQGLNVIGLKRAGFNRETIRVLRRAYRIVFESDNQIEEALAEIGRWPEAIPEITQFVEFIRTRERGIIS